MVDELVRVEVSGVEVNWSSYGLLFVGQGPELVQGH